MSVNKFSLKGVTLTLIIFLGIVAIAIALISNQHFYSVALDNQSTTLERITDVASNNLKDKMVEQINDFGRVIQANKTLRKALKKKDSAKLSYELDQSFKQNYITAGILDVVQLQIYDEDFNSLSSKSKDGTGKVQMPNYILSKLRARSGKERMKTTGQIWTDGQKPYYSMYFSLGGLKVRGYLEMVVNPVHSIKVLEKNLNAPIQILSLSDQLLYKSEQWTESGANGDFFVTDFTLKSGSGDEIMKIEVAEDISVFSNQAKNAGYIGLAALGTAILVVIAVMLVVFSKWLFQPIKNIMVAIDKLADDDLTIEIPQKGLYETYSIAKAMNQFTKNLQAHVRTIEQQASSVQEASEELSAIMQVTGVEVQKQTKNAEQSASIAHEMAASAAAVAENCNKAQIATMETKKGAESGELVVQSSIKSIHELSQDVNNAAETIKKLETDVHNIVTILDVIRSIAEQTNLLALNAAIEAARAGDQGRGFAVVADEVRTLAANTQDSTEEIQAMIEHLQKTSANAVAIMNQSQTRVEDNVQMIKTAGERLHEITVSVAGISILNEQIAHAADEQSEFAGDVNKSISNVTTSLEHISKSSTHVIDESSNLSKLSDELNKVVQQFTL